MKHKRGALLYAPILLVFMVFGLLYAWSEIVGKYKEFDRKIGARQFDLIDTYGLGERYLFYIDESAKYSAYQGIYDLAKSGGCHTGEEFSGEVFNGYRLWVIGDPALCSPDIDSSKESFFFSDFFPSEFNFYLSKYDPVKSLEDEYEFSFDNSDIIGNPTKELEIPIIQSKPGLQSPGIYTIKPSFRFNLSIYNFSDYDSLRGRALEFISNECKNEDLTRGSRNCIFEEKQFFTFDNFELDKFPDGVDAVEFLDYSWDPNKITSIRSSIYGFSVKSNSPVIYVRDEGDEVINPKNIVYKFALSFEDLSCTVVGHPEFVDTECKENSCDTYYSCKDIEPLCYCNDDKKSCQKKFESPEDECLSFCSSDDTSKTVDGNDNTHCRSLSCTDYRNCADGGGLLCACDTGNKCSDGGLSEESCPLCWADPVWTVGACGGSADGVSCGSTQKIKTRTVLPFDCTNTAECSSCDPDCDICNCDKGPDCGTCGHDPRNECGTCGEPDLNECGLCPGEPCPEPIPPNSCEGSCGGQAPAGCWCDSWCDDPLNEDPDCCGDESQWC